MYNAKNVGEKKKSGRKNGGDEKQIKKKVGREGKEMKGRREGLSDLNNT